MSIRDLVISIKNQVDMKPIKELDEGLADIKKGAGLVAAALIGVGTAAATGLGFAIKKGGELEQFTIAMETMLGSAEAAKKMIKELSDFAAKTPFELPDVEKNAKQLLAVGIEANKIIPTMKALGDVSSGLSVPLERIALNFGQIKTQGKLTGRELRDFAVAGVPLTAELAKMLGKSEKAIQEMVSRGEIGFDKVEKAFISMTSEGGRFANLMEKQSKSLFGIFSNISDSFTILFRDIGEELIPIIKPLIENFAKWLELNRDIIKSGLLSFFRSFALLLANVVESMGGLGKIMERLIVLAKVLFFTLMIAGIAKLIIGFQKVGLAGLLAWGKMLAPAILVGAAVAALILIIDELWTTLTDPKADTFLRRTLNWFEERFPKAFKSLKAIWEDISTLVGSSITVIVEGVSALINGIKGLFTGKFEAFVQNMINLKNALWDVIKSFAKLTFIKPLKFLFENAEGGNMMPGNIKTPMLPMRSGGNMTRIDAPIEVNVAGSSSSADEIGAAVSTAIDEKFNMMSYDLQQSIGG